MEWTGGSLGIPKTSLRRPLGSHNHSHKTPLRLRIDLLRQTAKNRVFRILAVSRNAHSAQYWPDKYAHKRRTERPDNFVVGLCFLFARCVLHKLANPLLLTKKRVPIEAESWL